jgi:hypothetical protein
VDKVYVVVGEEGSYSDRTEWLVAAYSDREQAERHVKRCERHVAEARAKYNLAGMPWRSVEEQREFSRVAYALSAAVGANPFDPQCPQCYEASYHVVEVPVAPLGQFAELIGEDGK